VLGPIHHVGYVVADLEAAVETLGRRFGLRVEHREVLPEQAVEAAFCGGGGGRVELIRPLDPDGPIARFMRSRGEGFHHVAFEVPDVAAGLAELAARGAELIDTAPRRGLGGHLVAFVHPRSALGVLTELVQAEPGRQG
jgi:methylmalonyl-CoA/ethylmalonyl-CoA epimerase